MEAGNPPASGFFWPVPAARVEILVPPDLVSRGRPFLFWRDTALVANPSLEEMREDVEAWARGEFDVAFRHWHEDVEWYPDVVGRLEGHDAYRGHDGLRRWSEAIEDVFDRVETSVAEVRDLGSRMVVLGTTRVFGKGSGMAVEEPLAFVLEMRDGKVARAVSYRDHAKALEAAGE